MIHPPTRIHEDPQSAFSCSLMFIITLGAALSHPFITIVGYHSNPAADKPSNHTCHVLLGVSTFSLFLSQSHPASFIPSLATSSSCLISVTIRQYPAVSMSPHSEVQPLVASLPYAHLCKLSVKLTSFAPPATPSHHPSIHPQPTVTHLTIITGPTHCAARHRREASESEGASPSACSRAGPRVERWLPRVAPPALLAPQPLLPQLLAGPPRS